MGKRHPNLPAWQWRSNPQSHQGSTHQAINLIAIPILIVAFLLLVSGVFSENATSAVIGLVALFAALILQHQGSKLDSKTDNSQTF
ncbi:terminase [Pseudomonas sp. CCI3.1]|uniref:terminase n=1 Tax=Pseudomonas sp. CCI3.1 TaxID=3048618 RepID=UPI002AB3CD6B|nr:MULTISPECIES: terminase [unclassified Pseudomonas]MDY7584427.1 terminase [Pseudomonas sp. CCI3.1]MEB0069698.1 terminase [Pseudomonas sp. CCI3.1]MEB0074078.1 terminase [Pseudomonas sp. CCI1.4]